MLCETTKIFLSEGSGYGLDNWRKAPWKGNPVVKSVWPCIDGRPHEAYLRKVVYAWQLEKSLLSEGI